MLDFEKIIYILYIRFVFYSFINSTTPTVYCELWSMKWQSFNFQQLLLLIIYQHLHELQYIVWRMNYKIYYNINRWFIECRDHYGGHYDIIFCNSIPITIEIILDYYFLLREGWLIVLFVRSVNKNHIGIIIFIAHCRTRIKRSYCMQTIN